MLNMLRRFTPAPFLNAYHRCLSFLAATVYGHPSEELIVVGVTGTNGKTTTSYFIAKALESMGPTGCATTALMKIGDREWLNDRKMTMLGRFALQKMLRDMVVAGCRVAVIETSSQGIRQHRHEDIHYDLCVLTNLTPEHLDAHGGFENYQQAKLELFHHLARGSQKTVHGRRIERTAILNADSERSSDFSVRGLDRVIWYGRHKEADVNACAVKHEPWSSSFEVDGARTVLQMPSDVNIENALAAFAVGRALGCRVEDIAQRLSSIPVVPGRFEKIDIGQPWTVVVDYAVEPVAMEKLYATLAQIPHGRLIHVFGSCGGGRDVARRGDLGRLAARFVDLAIITNEDPYDDDPEEIIQAIVRGARAGGMTDDRCLAITDRGLAIDTAMQRTHPGDLVVITGKGAEQAIMAAHGKKIPWDDRDAARHSIAKALDARR